MALWLWENFWELLSTWWGLRCSSTNWRRTACRSQEEEKKRFFFISKDFSLFNVRAESRREGGETREFYALLVLLSFTFFSSPSSFPLSLWYPIHFKSLTLMMVHSFSHTVSIVSSRRLSTLHSFLILIFLSPCQRLPPRKRETWYFGLMLQFSYLSLPFSLSLVCWKCLSPLFIALCVPILSPSFFLLSSSERHRHHHLNTYRGGGGGEEEKKRDKEEKLWHVAFAIFSLFEFFARE